MPSSKTEVFVDIMRKFMNSNEHKRKTIKDSERYIDRADRGLLI